MNKKIVAGAIIIENGRIFIACRPEGKTLAHHWEFPGGKQEPGAVSYTHLPSTRD